MSAPIHDERFARNLLWLGLVAASATAACGTPTSTDDAARVTTIAALTGDVTRGQSLYTTTCASCHGTDGKSGSAGENVAATAADDREGAIGQVIAGGDGMAAYGDTYTDQEIADLVGYLASVE